jgi:hypothetical protein
MLTIRGVNYGFKMIGFRGACLLAAIGNLALEEPDLAPRELCN